MASNNVSDPSDEQLTQAIALLKQVRERVAIKHGEKFSQRLGHHPAHHASRLDMALAVTARKALRQCLAVLGADSDLIRPPNPI